MDEDIIISSLSDKELDTYVKCLEEEDNEGEEKCK